MVHRIPQLGIRLQDIPCRLLGLPHQLHILCQLRQMHRRQTVLGTAEEIPRPPQL